MRGIGTVTKGLLCGFVVVGAIAVGAMADDAPDGHWKPPPVGTLLEYNYGESCRVIAVEEDGYVCKGDRSYWVQDVTWSVHRGIQPDMHGWNGAAITYDKRNLDKLFPLKVGKSVTISVSAGDYNWKQKFKVTSFKKIETRLGSRHVFGISFFGTGQDDAKWKGYGFLDAELGFWHSGKYFDVEPNKREINMRLFNLVLPTNGEEN